MDSNGIDTRSVSGDFNGWTLTSTIQQQQDGNLRAEAEFDDNGTGGRRSGGVCLVADLGLGSCVTSADCDAKATDAGLPADAGWFQYCEAAGSDPQKRCWTRPGPQTSDAGHAYCNLAPFNNLPNTVRSVVQPPEAYPDVLTHEPRYWTALSCLAGGFDANDAGVGDGLACATRRLEKFVYVIDNKIKSPPP